MIPKQDYLIKILRSKLEILLNKLGNVNEINYKIAKAVKFIPQTKNELQEALELLEKDKEAATEKYGDFKTWDTSNINFN